MAYRLFLNGGALLLLASAVCSASLWGVTQYGTPPTSAAARLWLGVAAWTGLAGIVCVVVSFAAPHGTSKHDREVD